MTGAHPDSSTLFLVDDEPSLLRLVVRVLEGAGHHVLTAGDVEGALGVLDKCGDQMDAAILDVRIPPDGVGALLDAILERHSGLPLILMSGDNLEAGLRDRLDACGGEFLRKPFLPRQLLEIVEEATRAVGESEG